MASLAEILSKLNTSKHRQTVLTELVNHLEGFRQTEVSPNHGDLVTDGVGKVPDSVIEGVIEDLQEEWVAPLEERISKIESMEVSDDQSEGAKNTSASSKKRSKQGAEKAPGLARGSKVRVTKGRGGTTRPVRATRKPS